MIKYLVLFLILPVVAFSQAGVDTSYVCDTCEYSSWALWESARDDDGDLPSIDSAVIAIRRDDETTTSHFIDDFRITGWTTDATRDISLKIPLNLDGSHGGIADTTGRFYGIGTIRCIRTQENYTNFDGFYLINRTNSTNRQVIDLVPSNEQTSRFVIENCILHYAEAGAGAYTLDVDGFNAGMQLHLRNNLLISEGTAQSATLAVQDLNCSLLVYNNTFYSNEIGVLWDLANDNNSAFTNNIFLNMDSIFVAQDAVDFSTYNATDADNWGGQHTPGTGDDSSVTFLFSDSASGGRHLADADAGAQGNGIDISSEIGGTAFDVDGGYRHPDFDIDIGYDQVGSGSLGLQIAASTDDAFRDEDGIDLSSLPPIMGDFNGADSDAGFRFLSVPIPDSSNIWTASIVLTSSDAWAEATVNLLVDMEDTDDAATFSTAGDFDGRVHTTANVAWSAVPSWVQHIPYISPDFADAVHEVVDRTGYDEDNDMVVFVNNNSSSTDAERACWDWDSEPKQSALFQVSWYEDTAAAVEANARRRRYLLMQN